MRNFLFIILFILFSTILKAQTGESSHIKISLLTCSPGEDLYTSFGHTAIRIIDSAKHSDVVFNYGTFNFDQPNFYLKFARGKLNYMLDESTFSDFMYEYYEDKRGVTEQDLSLSDAEKKFVITFLQNNYLPQNRNTNTIFCMIIVLHAHVIFCLTNCKACISTKKLWTATQHSVI